MKRRSHISVALLLFILAAFLGGEALAQEERVSAPRPVMEDYDGPAVTLSGRVIYPDYTPGQRITVTVKNSPSASIRDTQFARINLSGPGDYSIRVPQNLKDVYIIATVLKEGGMGFGENDYKWGIYSDSPMAVESSDIGDLDIIISRGYLMPTYQGPTVNISGKIDFPGFREGWKLLMTLRSSNYIGPPDIAAVDISGPGDYSVKVPPDIGNIYIRVVAFDPAKSDLRENIMGLGLYVNNPVRVAGSDIEGIDITINDANPPRF